MVNKPKRIGTAAETGVVRALQRLGFPDAERRQLRGARDAGDVTGTPGIAWEVKGGEEARQARPGHLREWLVEAETARHNAKAEIGVLVVQRRNVPPLRAEDWRALVPFWAHAQLVAGFWHPAEDTDLAVAPVEMRLGDLTRLLRLAGYGDPLPGMNGTRTPEWVRRQAGMSDEQLLVSLGEAMHLHDPVPGDLPGRVCDAIAARQGATGGQS